ncbi:MAG: hypothetical protein U1A72_02770 [Sulfuritalea sp.]|nr:hypothetical protein [Sulfuritalea sp.]
MNGSTAASMSIPMIIGRYFKSIANCAAVAREVDRLYRYDNSVDGEACGRPRRESLKIVNLED